MIVDGKEVEVPVEEEPEYYPDGRRKRKKGRGPLEWIIAVDAHFVTPLAWEAYQAEEAQLAVAQAVRSGQASSSCSSRAGPCPRRDKEDHPPPPPPDSSSSI